MWRSQFPLEPIGNQIREDRARKVALKWRLWSDLRQAIWLWHTFGGLGARSRRGWGSVQLIEIVGDTAIPELGSERSRWRESFKQDQTGWDTAAAKDVLRRFLKVADCEEKNLTFPYAFTSEGARPRTIIPAPQKPNGIAATDKEELSFSTLKSACAVVETPPVLYSTWQEALRRPGSVMQDVRSTNVRPPKVRSPTPEATADRDKVRSPTPEATADRDNVRDLLHGSVPTLSHAPYRAAFGLPHNYFFKATPIDRTEYKVSFQGATKERTRRASPVFIHVRKVWDHTNQRWGYLSIVLWLKAHIAAGGVSMIQATRTDVNPNIGFGQAPPRPDRWRSVVQFLYEFGGEAEPPSIGPVREKPRPGQTPIPPGKQSGVVLMINGRKHVEVRGHQIEITNAPKVDDAGVVAGDRIEIQVTGKGDRLDPYRAEFKKKDPRAGT